LAPPSATGAQRPEAAPSKSLPRRLRVLRAGLKRGTLRYELRIRLARKARVGLVAERRERRSGRLGVELFLAILAAIGFTAAAMLGRRLVPDPWATGAALAVGLSPPAVLAATTISPAMTCAALSAIQAQYAEDALLYIGVMDPDAAAAGLVAVDHQVVGLGPDQARVAIQLVHVLVARRGERVMVRRPAFSSSSQMNDGKSSTHAIL